MISTTGVRLRFLDDVQAETRGDLQARKDGPARREGILLRAHQPSLLDDRAPFVDLGLEVRPEGFGLRPIR